MSVAETKKSALFIKMKIVGVFTRTMLRKDIDYMTMAKDLRISQKRVRSLLDNTDLSLDLFELVAVSKYLNITLIIRIGSEVIYRGDRIPEGLKEDTIL